MQKRTPAVVTTAAFEIFTIWKSSMITHPRKPHITCKQTTEDVQLETPKDKNCKHSSFSSTLLKANTKENHLKSSRNCQPPIFFLSLELSHAITTPLTQKEHESARAKHFTNNTLSVLCKCTTTLHPIFIVVLPWIENCSWVNGLKGWSFLLLGLN